MSEHILNRRKEDIISQKTSVSLGFVITILTIGMSSGWAIWNYLDSRMTTMEQAVYQMSGDVHTIKGEVDILVSEKNKTKD